MIQKCFEGEIQKIVSGIRRRKREPLLGKFGSLQTFFLDSILPSCQELFNWNKG